MRAQLLFGRVPLHGWAAVLASDCLCTPLHAAYKRLLELVACVLYLEKPDVHGLREQASAIFAHIFVAMRIP